MFLFVDLVKDVLFEHCTGTAVNLHAVMLISSPERAELQHHYIIDGARHSSTRASRLRLSHYDTNHFSGINLLKAVNVLMLKFFQRIKRIQTYFSAGYQLCFGTYQRSQSAMSVAVATAKPYNTTRSSLARRAKYR